MWKQTFAQHKLQLSETRRHTALQSTLRHSGINVLWLIGWCVVLMSDNLFKLLKANCDYMVRDHNAFGLYHRAEKRSWQITCPRALNLSYLHVLNISFPSLWPRSDSRPRVIIYLGCQSPPLEFTRACSRAWNTLSLPPSCAEHTSACGCGFTQMPRDDKREPEKPRTRARKNKGGTSLFFFF